MPVLTGRYGATREVGVAGVFSDWAATSTFYANCAANVSRCGYNGGALRAGGEPTLAGGQGAEEEGEVGAGEADGGSGGVDSSSVPCPSSLRVAASTSNINLRAAVVLGARAGTDERVCATVGPAVAIARCSHVIGEQTHALLHAPR
eukprot:1989766-Rhodomonas_salina.1